MTTPLIKNLFANDIHRRIEEVIKVDQTDDDILRDEINEYVVTDAIRSHYTHIFDAYRETPNKPHEGIAVWVSGFFGSGKSSFAKMLGLSIENRSVAGVPAGGTIRDLQCLSLLDAAMQLAEEGGKDRPNQGGLAGAVLADEGDEAWPQGVKVDAN